MTYGTLPTFLGIGGKKCATTWLSECLRRHPEIFMASPKELHFFEDSATHRLGLEWYLGHFAGGARFRARGEMTATYLTLAPDPHEIRSTLGEDLKLVVSLRDPISRFVSEYKHEVRTGALSIGPGGVLDEDRVENAIRQIPTMLENGLFGKHIRRFRAAFPAENFLILTKPEIDGHPTQTVQRVYEFLGVNSAIVPDTVSRKVSVGIVPKYPVLERIRHIVFRRAKSYAPGLINVVRRTGIADAYRRLNRSPGDGGGITVTPGARAHLTALYAEDASLLAAQLADWTT